MVSGRCAALFRQFILIVLLFAIVTTFIVTEERITIEETRLLLYRLQKIQRDNGAIIKQIDAISKNFNRTKELVQAHINQLEIIEQFTKKKNLILTGITESDDEDLEETVLKIFLDKLNLQVSKSEIELVQRIEGDDPRPILIRFVRLKQKLKIFYKRKSLPKIFSLEEDLTSAQREHRKHLDAYVKAASRQGKSVKWIAGKLLIDGVEVDPKSIL